MRLSSSLSSLCVVVFISLLSNASALSSHLLRAHQQHPYDNPLKLTHSHTAQTESPALLQFFDADQQIRGFYDGRRRMAPYGGFDSTDNPYRAPNNPRSDDIFFTPKVSNMLSVGPDPTLAIAGMLGSQRQMSLNRYQNSVVYNSQAQSEVGGPGWRMDSGAPKPYGIDPFSDPFTYYTPPPIPSTATPPGGVNTGTTTANPTTTAEEK